MSRVHRSLVILSTLALSGIAFAAEFFPSPWKRIGPEPTAITVHGAADIDPRDSGVLYFVSRGPDGTRVGEDGTEGFWKSEDGGATWTRIDAAVGSSVNSGQGVRIDPADPDRVFVGQEDVERWSVSVDTGETFSPGDGSPLHIICMEFDPINSDIVYVGTDRAVYKSADAGDSWVHQIGNGLPPTGVGISSTVTALATDPTASGIVYAGFLYGEWETPWGVYKTTDGGASWAPKNRGLPESGTPFQDRGIADLAIARSRPQTLYAASYFTGEMFRTDDGAEHWVKIPGVPFPDTFDAGGAWPRAITVDPDDPDRILVGTNEYSVFLSNDGGRNFTALGYVPDVKKTDQNDSVLGVTVDDLQGEW